MKFELKFFRYCDTHSAIKKWASEEIYVKYLSPKDRRIHRYFPDVIIQSEDDHNIVTVTMIEIKPDKQTRPPIMGKTQKSKRRFLKETMTYGINAAKWNAARIYCKERNWKFLIITEKDLGVSYVKKKK